jgi:hypothetical protein
MSTNILIFNNQIVKEEQCNKVSWLHTENTITAIVTMTVKLPHYIGDGHDIR